MKERFRPIKSFPDYLVSSMGRVKSLKRTDVAFLTGRLDKDGYVLVDLRNENLRKTVRVHVLVAEAFVGPRTDGQLILHWNDRKSDNRLSNLRYGSLSENYNDRRRNGSCNSCHRNPATQIGIRLAKKILSLRGDKTAVEISKEKKVSVNQVYRIWSDKHWKEIKEVLK